METLNQSKKKSIKATYLWKRVYIYIYIYIYIYTNAKNIKIYRNACRKIFL